MKTLKIETTLTQRGWTILLLPTLLLGTTAAVAQLPERPIFREVSAEVGLDFTHFNGMTGELYFAEMTGGGGALFDYDQDGDLDVYLVQGHLLGEGKTLDQAIFQPRHPLPLTDRLYRNDLEILPDGSRRLRFTDVTAASGLEATTGYGMGVAAGDFDDDGRIDLYLANFGSNQLLRNRGAGPDGRVTFEDVTARAGVGDPRWSLGASFFDYDRDGRLDLYVVNYVDFRLTAHKTCRSDAGARDYCGPNAYDPVPDRLYRNRGDGTFEDVTEPTGIGSLVGPGMGVVTADFNRDGWSDVYVANDGKPNFLWINQRPDANGRVRFEDEALLAGAGVNADGQSEASMGVIAGDVDGDGDDDLFTTHLTRESNTLYLNDGQGMFRDATHASGLRAPSLPFTGFGTALIDYDGDGRQDLFVANGAVTFIKELQARHDPYPLHQTNQLFRNLGSAGTPRFEDVSAQAGPALELSEVSRGVAAGDVDNDGDGDLLVVNNAGPVRLLLNQVGQDLPWLGLRLVGGAGPRDQLGAEVTIVRSGASSLFRRVATDGSYASANDSRLTIGLGEGGKVEAVRVRWPDGSREAFPAPALGRYTTLRQGRGEKLP